MIRDITIGQFYPANSVIHGIDARVKLIATFVYIITLFLINNFLGFAFAALALSVVIRLSKVPVKFMFKGVKGIFVIIILTSLINIFTIRDGTVIFQMGWFKVTVSGVIVALKIVVRLILLIVGSSLMTLTTTPIKLTDGIEYLLKPFKKFGVPAHDIAMMMTIALRFIPTLLEETDKIIKAQQARGADFETGNLIQRAKSLIPILVPLFISSFRRADDLAMAMEARCYNGDENRTRMNEMRLDNKDFIAIFLICLYVLIIIVIRIFFKTLI